MRIWFELILKITERTNPILPFTETPPVQRAACALPFEGSPAFPRINCHRNVTVLSNFVTLL